MDLWIGIVIAVVVVVVAGVLFIASRPSTYRVERSAIVNAAPELVFPIVNDLHNWGSWSPWDKHDPAMKKTYEGTPSGLGAIYMWDGNNKIGSGRMEITESENCRHVGMKLEFFRPFQATNLVQFEFAPADGGTRVTWGMDGNLNFMMKAFSLVMNMKKMLGTDFDEGLANLNRVVQAEKLKVGIS